MVTPGQSGSSSKRSFGTESAPGPNLTQQLAWLGRGQGIQGLSLASVTALLESSYTWESRPTQDSRLVTSGLLPKVGQGASGSRQNSKSRLGAQNAATSLYL